MAGSLSTPWIRAAKLEPLLQPEGALLLFGMAASAWVIYRTTLGKVSKERHENLRNLFSNLVVHIALASVLALFYFLLKYLSADGDWDERLISYPGFFALISGITVFVKAARILVFEYLFLSHMREGVPLLLVNIFTLLLCCILAGWLGTELFSLDLTSLLATSAILSLVLGLALQDTMGNLFAGVALQFQKPFEIGDWLEVYDGPLKWTGQVVEMHWRATVLKGFWDEHITISNRVMGQAKIANFTGTGEPILRSLVFRVPFGTNVLQLRQTLLKSANRIQGVRQYPQPLVLLSDTTESWVVAKLVFYIDDYGAQFLIIDKVLAEALEQLQMAGIALASDRLEVKAPGGRQEVGNAYVDSP